MTTGAVTGGADTVPKYPNVPVTAEQIAHAAIEDNLYIGKGELARDSAQLVERAMQIIRLMGVEPMPPDEARPMLKLRGGGGRQA
jgi:uncharacterized protein (DUF849 family)